MEASLEQVPFVTFKVGGVPELLNVTDEITSKFLSFFHLVAPLI